MKSETRNERIEPCDTHGCGAPLRVWDWYIDDRSMGKLADIFEGRELHAKSCPIREAVPQKWYTTDPPWIEEMVIDEYKNNS